ncbi:MAG: Cupin domain protein [Chloroflexi bacterium]|jgi:quercetin dioxygenase-like cupin family protein|nr:MAG: Cupin domain protein [Chloroflexota bacterium]
MKIRKISEVAKEAVDSPLFTSKEVTRQPLAPESTDYNVAVVSFGSGVRNKFHYHGSDQLLIVTEGKGKVVTESGEEAEVTEGDVVFAPAGEKHWHGALPGTTFAHITVTRKGTETVQTED